MLGPVGVCAIKELLQSCHGARTQNKLAVCECDVGIIRLEVAFLR